MFSTSLARLLAILMVSVFSLPSAVFAEPPTLRFGMEVANQDGGVRVESIKPTRPIAKKLAVGDVLISYVLLDQRSEQRSVAQEEDIDALKAVIASGRQVELTFLRPYDSQIPPRNYMQLTTIVDASDLIIPQLVEETIPFTVSAPYATSNIESTVDENQMAKVLIYYSTDRALQQGQYSGVRDLGPASIKYGVCEVTIPPNHKSGHVEGPKWWKLEFSSDPRQHIYLSSVSQIGKQGIEASMDAHFNQMRDIPRRRLLLFVHGYNVSFEEAALRTAQMHFDLDFQGLSAFFSWPSDGTTRAYVSDSGDIEWSKPHIAEVLSYYETNPNIDDIFVIAHSMGNRGTLQALLELRNRGAGKKIKEIILAAPDVDAVIFDRDIAPSISSYFPRTTIYASSNDMALRGSQTLNAIERVGEIRNNEPTVRTIPKLDVIDASSVSTDLLGHSYFGDGTSIISDMYYLMHKEVSPPRFNMTSKTGARGSFWKIK